MASSPPTPAADRQAKGLGWLNALLGSWLIIAPFALRYDYALFQTARWNDIIVGLFVTFFALLRAVRGSLQPVWTKRSPECCFTADNSWRRH